MLNIAVLGSGRGSNLQAILSAMHQGKIPNARVCLVLSNNSGAGILEIARNNSLPALHVSRQHYQSEEAFVTALLGILESHRVNLIVLAGYMKQIPPRVIAAYRNRILNVHPALLPSFGGKGMYGMRVHEAVLAARSTQSGATVHLVDEEYDHGTIVLQERVDISPDETPETLAMKVLTLEHALLPEAIRRFSETAGVPIKN